MSASKRLFLLDGMALVYRAHFAFIARPIRTAQGLNTSALYGFVQTLLDIMANGAPTHLAVAFDTDAPTPRHEAFPEYKAQRQVMPEELSAALPSVRRFIEAFNLCCLSLDGFEADDIIGTLVRRAEPQGFESFMVTPDKDFGQLVTERTRLWKPGRQGSDIEILGPAEVCARWGIARVEQVIDLLGLMGDATDNIPGVPGVGEKTAAKLIAQYGSLEGVLEHADELKGKLAQSVREHAAQARLSKQLATILTDVPLNLDLEAMAIRDRNETALQSLCVEFEFNALGRRLFGDGFKAGRGFSSTRVESAPVDAPRPEPAELDLFGQAVASGPGVTAMRDGHEPLSPGRGTRPTGCGPGALTGRFMDSSAFAGSTPREPLTANPSQTGAALRSLADSPHEYEVVGSTAQLSALVRQLGAATAFGLAIAWTGTNPGGKHVSGIAVSCEASRGWFVPLEFEARPEAAGVRQSAAAPTCPPLLRELLPFLTNPQLTKVGHDLKPGLLALKREGIEVRGPFFDTMIAHALIEPEQRHGLAYGSGVYLGYTPLASTPSRNRAQVASPDKGTLAPAPVEDTAVRAMESADLALQLREKLAPLLQARAQERVFYQVEMPVLPTLVAMECEGIRVEAGVLKEFSVQLAHAMAAHEAAVHRLAGRVFNVNSNRQLGEVLFDQLKLVERAKKTATGQYATDEQTLQALAPNHEIVRHLLEYRTVSKLKSTYADTLPEAISPQTGRIHTTYHQAATATGRLSSQDPNLQNIPIRTELGQEIRRAFVSRPGSDWCLLSADYSQIELRILASMSGETAMREAFVRGEDIHTDTAARVYGVMPGLVTSEQRRRAKMVNYGIAYGISGFGLAQRLGIPRKEAAEIIEHYFASYPGIRRYMDDTIASARERGFVETLTGRRRYLLDVRSANATVRAAAERNAINAPIQGTAADLIKIAMARIHEQLSAGGMKSRMLLQVHDELVFDLYRPEEAAVRALVTEQMRSALTLEVPLEVEIGVGANWLEAHE